MFTRCAVVTGANQGIGYEIVKGLKKALPAEYAVVLCSRDEEKGKEACHKLEQEGVIVDLGILDIANKQSVQDFTTFIKEKYSTIDILINNAGFAFKNAAKEPFNVQARTTIDINYYGTLDITRSLLPIIKPGGRIINVSSMAGKLKILSKELQDKFTDPNLTVDQLSNLLEEFITLTQTGEQSKHGWPSTAYGVSKVGVSALTRILAKENDGLLINACCPGWCRTSMAGQQASKSAAQGATTPILLATAPETGSGRFWTEEQPAAW